MKDIRKVIVAILIIIAGLSNANAKGFQPRVFISDPELYNDDNYSGADTVPAKLFIKAQLSQPAQIKRTPQLQPEKVIQVKPELTAKPAQNATVVLTKPQRRDSALIRMLYNGFKPQAKSR